MQCCVTIDVDNIAHVIKAICKNINYDRDDGRGLRSFAYFSRHDMSCLAYPVTRSMPH